MVAPTNVINRNAALRNIQPPALTQGRPLPPSQPVTNIRLAQANLNKPNIIPAPKNVPSLPAQIPKAPPLAAQPLKGVGPGTGLPARATMPLTPQQQAHIQQLPPKPGVGAATTAHPAIAPKPGVSAQPKGTVPPGTFQAGGAKAGAPPSPPSPGQFKPSTTGQTVRPQPQVKPTRPQPQPMTQSPQPRPQPQIQPRLRPQPQMQSRPQPLVQQPRPQAQPPRVAPAPQPRPAPAAKPPPQPQQQQKQKKPGET
jgi:hypothetical protein